MNHLAVLVEPLSQIGTDMASPTAGPQPRLVKAAHEFEAAMMKELLAPMTARHSLLGEGDDGEGSESALTSFAGEALGKAISEHGGFGLAKSIIRQLSRQQGAGSNHFGTSPVLATGQVNHPNSPSK
jgi:Rod binding domain-containing protein